MPDLTTVPSVDMLTELGGKKVLVRVDLNIPLQGNAPRDTARIEAILPTVNLLLSRGAKVVLISHRDDGESLASTGEFLRNYFPVRFARQGEALTFEDSSVVLLENLRFSSGEEDNDPLFARELASLADVYVNEAFPVSHREHASIVSLPALLPSYAGLNFLRELRELSTALSPEHPFLFILGGAKVSTKEPLLRKFLGRADHVFAGGVLANDFLKSKGYPVGRSILSDTEVDAELVGHPRALLPEDLLVTGGADGDRVATAADVGMEERIVDIGPRTAEILSEHIRSAALVLWNGPLGLYEEGFHKGSLAIAEAMAESSARTILGGGDTLAVLPKELKEKMSFVSTGGGAMLHFLAEETLPGLEALTQRA